GDGVLRVRVTKTGGETALAQIMNLVRQAQETKPRVQRLADRAATALTLIAVGLGIATFLYWFGFAKADSLFALTLMITVFVIACPHALGLAIPTVTVLATTMGAQRGLLIRNAEGLEIAKDVHTVVFDKTGTLTRGEFGVSDVIALGGWSETDLLRIAAAVERNSEHVIAKAIVARSESQSLGRPDVFDFAAIPGKGARAKVERHAVALGNQTLLTDVGIAIGAGTDVAMESADIVLVRNDPRDVVRLIRLSRLTSTKMRQNLVWATGYNAVALPLAAGVGVPAGVVLRPEWGALFMAASSIIVVANALLMKRQDI